MSQANTSEMLPRERPYAAFGAALDALRARTEADLGEKDLTYLRRMTWFSRAMEVLGRGLIHFSLEPVGFCLGVLALWVHKQLETMELGHMVLHGVCDTLPGAGRFRSRGYRWRLTVDEKSWSGGHNLAHHPYTNVLGRDPDVRFGPVRINPQVPYEPAQAHQFLYSVLMWPFWSVVMAMNYAGLTDVYLHGAGSLDFLPDKSWRSIRDAHLRFLRKLVPYALVEYGLFPLLAGPFFWKVALGNFLAGRLRDTFSALTIYCNHIGDGVEGFPEGRRASHKGEWYAMQVQGANNFEVPLWLSILCGTVDRHIEHHLFPRMPTNRLREMAPEVRRICEEHGIPYKTGSLPAVLGQALRRIIRLSRAPEAIPFATRERTP